jgi:arylformamidase
VKILDISPAVTPDIAVWPGDVGFSRSVALSIAGGANLDLSSITTTVHLGAHTDAPSHYVGGGPGIGDRALDRYLGRCQVVRVDVSRGSRVRPEHVRDPIVAPRVLFHTGTFPDPNHWNSDFASLSPELVDWLAPQGVVLVGIDTPSVDPEADRELLSHHAIARHDLGILEGIVLDDVEPGEYVLVALPLRIPGADASPVRAVLLPVGSL